MALPSRSSRLRITCLVLLTLSPAAAALQARRLNDPLPLGSVQGTVRSFQVTPDESRVVFLADPDIAGRVALLSSALAGPPDPTVISEPSLDAVLAFQVAPAGDRVVYTARGGDVLGVYSTLVTGGARSKLLARGEVRGLGVSPDGARAVFAILQGTSYELQTVPIDGSAAPLELENLDPSEGASGFFLFLPDGSRVVYRAFGVLRSAPSDGSAPSIELAPAAGLNTTSLVLTPDGSRALYLSLSGFAVQLFSVPTDGSAGPVRLDDAPTSTRGVERFALSPDGGSVAFTSEHHSIFGFDLSIVPVTGGAIARLYTPVDLSESASSPRFSPDGDHVLFLTASSGADRKTIRSVPSDGSAPPAVLVGPGNAILSVEYSLDGSRIAFSRNRVDATQDELLSLPADGSAAPTLLDDDVSYGTFARAPAEDRLVYRTGANGTGISSVPMAGGASPAVLASMPAGSLVQSDLLLTRSGLALYRADPESQSRIELFGVAISGASPARKLNGSLGRAVVGDVIGFQVSRDAAFFVADQETDDEFGIYRVGLGGGRLTRLNPPLPPGRGGWDFLVAPDGRSVVYRNDQDEFGKNELYRVAADGSSGAQKISGVLPSFADVRDYDVSPDSASVVFVADRDVDEKVEIFGVDASGVPLRLGGPLVPAGDVGGFRISADSRRVVYRGDLVTDGVPELFSAPLDASGGQVRLHAPLPAGRSVDSFELSPDGALVAFSGDLVTNGKRELFTVPADGSLPPVKVNADLGTQNVKNNFQFTADGSRLVFRLGPSNHFLYGAASDGSTGHVALGEGDPDDLSFELAPQGHGVVFRKGLELYSVLDDGSSPPVLLATECLRYRITPDASRVVSASLHGLDVVPIDGSAAPFLLDPRGMDAQALDFSPDGSVLLFLWLSELQAIPLDGSRPAERIGGHPVYHGMVSAFRALPGGRVVFQGDIDVDDTTEMWLGLYGGRDSARRR